jgi:DNA-binding transcriptional LysR family regulator
LESRYRLMTKQLYGVDVSKLSNLMLCSDYSVLIKLVLSGDFITAGPRFTFRDEIKKDNLKVMVMDERVKHRIHLIANRSALSFPALENVILNIQQVVKNQPN